LGGLAGYAIGVLAFESIGQSILNWYDAKEMYVAVQGHYANHGFLYVFIAGFTPIPYKIFTIAAGVFELALVPFIFASVVSRSARFFLVAAVIYIFGESVNRFIDRWFNVLTVAFSILLVGGFLVIKMVLH
jgi:membrane protein YqaA with SNARE-associated domain